MKHIHTLILMAAICFTANAQLVVKVIDGDTYKVLLNAKLQNIRLQNIDAPELDQYFGKAIKDSVAKLLEGSMLSLELHSSDIYGRTLVTATYKGMSLDSLLIAKGWAWFYTKYSHKTYLKDYEAAAKLKSLGLWRCEHIWNVIEITEHLFWAEQGALYGMRKTLLAIREGGIQKNYDSIHKDLPIEKIIEQTWRPKEIVPAVAAPRLGGSLAFWKASLHSLQSILEEFGNIIKEDELRLLAHPHPISGALDFQQRIEFLSFHINRHKDQVVGLLDEYNKQNI